MFMFKIHVKPTWWIIVVLHACVRESPHVGTDQFLLEMQKPSCTHMSLLSLSIFQQLLLTFVKLRDASSFLRGKQTVDANPTVLFFINH
jgi:hypothetical protein